MKQNHEYDLIILGGGTVGIALCLDAALRGLKTLVIERGKIGRQTNAASSGLIQGGLKYLSRDLELVQMDSADCGLLKKVVPHLLVKRKFIIPIFPDSKHGLWFWDGCLNAYDRFSSARGVEIHEILSQAQIQEAEPLLTKSVLGGAIFEEWVTDPVELIETLTKVAVSHGAEIWEDSNILAHNEYYHPESGKRVLRELVVECKNCQVKTVRGNYFVNACGPWAPGVIASFGLKPFETRPTRGTSIILNKKLVENAVILFDKRGKYLLVMSLGENQTMVGPTNYDVPEEVKKNPDLLRPEEYEIDDLLAAVNSYFGNGSSVVSRSDIVGEKCGLRPQLNDKTKSPDKISHAVAVIDHEERDGLAKLATVYGGKLSGLFTMAREANDFIAGKILRPELEERWAVSRLRISIEGHGVVRSCGQDCLGSSSNTKKFALSYKDEIGKVAFKKMMRAVCFMAPFVLKALIRKVVGGRRE